MVVVWWRCGVGVGWVLVRVVGIGFGYVVAWFGGGGGEFQALAICINIFDIRLYGSSLLGQNNTKT